MNLGVDWFDIAASSRACVNVRCLPYPEPAKRHFPTVADQFESRNPTDVFVLKLSCTSVATFTTNYPTVLKRVEFSNGASKITVTMGKLLLTLTLVVFLSGVLCAVTQNLTKSGPTAAVARMGRNFIGRIRANGTCVGVPTHKLHKRPMHWNEARISCISEGGQLVVINSDAEGAMLVDWMKKEDIERTWIGTHDMFKTYDWVTLTGETLEAAGYDNWLRDQPDNTDGNEHCGTLVISNGMDDYPCDRRLSYFCKIYIC